MDIQTIALKLEKEKEITLQCKVIPKSSKNEIVGILPGGTIRIKVKAVPEKGKANDELITFFAKQLKIAKRNITILRGETTHLKTIHITL